MQLQSMEYPIITTPSQLRDFIREAVKEVAGVLRQSDTSSNQDGEMLSEREALAYLGGISKPTLHKLIAKGLIQKHKAGEKRNLYSRTDLRAYVLNQKTA